MNDKPSLRCLRCDRDPQTANTSHIQRNPEAPHPVVASVAATAHHERRASEEGKR